MVSYNDVVFSMISGISSGIIVYLITAHAPFWGIVILLTVYTIGLLLFVKLINSNGKK